MNNEKIQKYSDFLLSIAIPKCGSLQDAQDLVQDTMLAALTFEAKGKKIQNYEAFLRTILNRRYYDYLRRKYRLPTVFFSQEPTYAEETFEEQRIGSNLYFADEQDFVNEMIRHEDAEQVRREVAFLSESYRSILVEHYFYGHSIKDIATKMKLPIGTVKSRMNFARQQLKKGITTMENYTENSYMPQSLHIANTGACGIHMEPMSLVPYDDPLTQNLLILAYDKPVAISELSKAIGVPSAYVEPIIHKLLQGELMKQTRDGRVYTDFIIYQAEDYVKYIKEQEAFAETYSGAYLEPIKEAITELKQTNFYSERLERHMLIHVAEDGLWTALENHRPPQILPDRPNGGKWIAFGTVSSRDYTIPMEQQGKEEYGLSGHRITRIDKYLQADNLRLYNYETTLYPYSKFDDYGYESFLELETDMLKLFYLIEHNISPETVDCDARLLKAIPLLEERGYLTIQSGVPKLLIPHLTHKQAMQYWVICDRAQLAFAKGIEEPLATYVLNHKKKIPAHLKSVPAQKLTKPYEPSAMMFVFEAIYHGIHPRDLGYACPETLVVFD